MLPTRRTSTFLIARKGTLAVAAVDGTVSWLHHDTSGLSGNMPRITDAEGWQYVYIHLNNDGPGTDDGANRYDEAFVDGIRAGQQVRAGEPIAYVGDSGNAENTGAHLHFELRSPDGVAVNAYSTLRGAQIRVWSQAELDTARPFGSIDQLSATAPGTITMAGWVVDRAVGTPSDVTLLLDGNPVATVQASGSRPDVASMAPGATPEHGFSRVVSGLPAGPRRACVVAHNAGTGGGSTRLGCTDLAIP